MLELDKSVVVLDFVVAYLDRNGYAPSIREIRDGTGISSTSVVAYHLNRLEQDGYINRDSATSRSITLTQRADNAISKVAKMEAYAKAAVGIWNRMWPVIGRMDWDPSDSEMQRYASNMNVIMDGMSRLMKR